MATVIEAVVRLFTHYILPSGERVLRSGIHPLPEGAEEIKSGASYPAMMNWLTSRFDGWGLRFIPLDLLVDDLDDDGNVIVEAFDKIQPVDGHTKFITWTQDETQVVLSVEGNGVKANIFKVLGLIVLAAVKTPKRLKELARLSYMVSTFEPVIAEYTHYRHVETDGRGAIKLSYFLDMLEQGCYNEATKNRIKYAALKGKLVVAGFRLHGPKGQLKLEVNIVPDHIFGALHGFDVDIAVHADEWKKELISGVGYFAHAWPKEHTHGPAMMDVQTASWMKSWMFAEAEVRSWVTAVFAQAITAVRLGTLPKWMEVTLLEDEDGYEYARTSDLQNQAKQYVKWQLWGMNPSQSANLIYMAWLSLKQRAVSRDIWAPIPFAARHHVCTRRFVTDLCGYKVKSRPLGRVNFDPRVQCLVYSSWLFIKLADSHGGWDQDGDTVVIALRVTEDGDIVGVCWRNPDSSGEYSVVEVDVDSIPVYFDDLEGIDMPSVVLANKPRTLTEVRARRNMLDLATPEKGEKKRWNELFARALFAAQKLNPHIGRVANADMVMASQDLEPEFDYPLEDKVDTCMGSPYAPAFEQIEAWIQHCWELVAAHGRMDRFFVGGWKAKGASKKIKGRIPVSAKEDLTLYDGYFTRLHRFIMGEATAYGEELGKLSLELRARNPIGDLTEPGYFPKEAQAMVMRGRKLVTWSMEQYEAVARAYPRSKDELNDYDPDNTGPINKARRSEANKQIVRQAVATLSKIDEADRVTVLVAAYRFCMEPNGADVYGRPDRILYAHAGEDEVSVMDLWLDVLVKLGYASGDAVMYGTMIPIMEEELNAALARVLN